MRNTAHCISIASLALGLLASMSPMARADAKDSKNAWGAAAVAAGVGAVIEASKDRPLNAAALAAGAAYAYSQYGRAQDRERDDRFSYDPVGYDSRDYRGSRDDDPYGYDRYDGADSRGTRPSWRPGARRGPYSEGDTFYRPSASYTRSTRQVSGIVTGTSSSLKREIKVRLDNGQERTIEVPRDVRIRDRNRDISVHDLDKGDVVRIRIERYDSRGDLKAARVDVIDHIARDRGDDWSDDRDVRDNTRVVGRVSSIDSRSNILRVDANGRRLTVYTDRAALRDRDGGIRLRDLENGDRVVVEGRRDGDRLYATRVTLE